MSTRANWFFDFSLLPFTSTVFRKTFKPYYQNHLFCHNFNLNYVNFAMFQSELRYWKLFSRSSFVCVSSKFFLLNGIDFNSLKTILFHLSNKFVSCTKFCGWTLRFAIRLMAKWHGLKHQLDAMHSRYGILNVLVRLNSFYISFKAPFIDEWNIQDQLAILSLVPSWSCHTNLSKSRRKFIWNRLGYLPLKMKRNWS